MQPLHIKFNNTLNPSSTFDLLKLERLFQRKYADHSPDQLHRVEFFVLLFITEGNGSHTIDFTDYKLEKGSLLTIRKDQVHRFHRNQNVKGYLLLFKDDFLASYLGNIEAQKVLQLFNELLGVPKVQLPKDDYPAILSLITRIEQEYFQRMDEYALGIIRSELHILITKLYRIKAERNQIISSKKYLAEFIEFQRLVEQHASNTTRVSDYAQMMSISAKTLNTIAKTIINKTAKTFIDDINIKQIKRLLINTSFSIKEIAYTSGFEETSNFYKYFKQRVGLTPEQFRSTF